jgi:diadenosine tetraphosphate (Ap4A) HIT family hydrolase
MKLPYAEPLTILEPSALVLPEPPRPGDPGGAPCGLCDQDAGIWSDANWVVHNPVGGSIPGTVWLASREHFESFADMPAHLAADFARIIGRVEAAILGLGGLARVHLYRWGDGNAHFHVWLLPRPEGMLDATKHALPLWEDVLPKAPQEAVDAAGAAIAEVLGRS